MEEIYFNNRERGFIGIIIVVVTVGLIVGGFYYYLQKQIPKVPEITKKSVEEEVVKAGKATPAGEIIAPGETAPEEKVEKEPVVQKYINPRGILLVRTNSNVEKVANEIADKRNWVFLSAETTDPLEMKNKIKGVIKEYPTIEYLLIIGTDKQIPLEDHWDYVKYEESQTYGGQGAVLDSLFYGNIDEDIFVELEVGRIPFDNESDVRNYFNNLTVGGSKNYYVYYPIYEEISDAEKSPGVCLSKEFSNTAIAITPKKEDLLKTFDDAQVVAIHTHGGPSSWALKDDYFDKNDVPNLSTRPLIIANTCLSAQELGPEFLKKGAGAFIGEYFVSGDFWVNRLLVLSKKIFSGNSLGSALKNYLNYGIAMATVNKEFEYNSAEEPIMVMNVNNLVTADHTVILLGDPSIAIQSVSSFLNKTTLEKKTDKIYIKIPKPAIETIDDAYVVGCYGGENETNKKGWIEEHWNLVMNLGKTPKWIVGNFVFPIEGVNAIKDGKEIIGGKEFEFKTVRFPFVSLVKGDKERYIAIEETLVVDSSVFFNPREIILEF